MIKRIFWDLEVSPCIGSFWRPGYKINLSYNNIEVPARIITAAWKYQGHKKVFVSTWAKAKDQFAQDDSKVVRSVVDVLNDADEIVAHYGNGFDVPWLKTRALYHGIITGNWKTVDTHSWAKKHFLLPTNKLDAIAQYLGLGAKIRTDYNLWRDITFKDCPKALAKMVKYNQHDVELLEQVWEKLQAYAPPPTHAGVHEGLATWTCPECGAEPKKRQRPMVSSKGIVTHQMYCGACPRYYMINNTAHNQWDEHRNAY